jgi:hypothetical protein
MREVLAARGEKERKRERAREQESKGERGREKGEMERSEERPIGCGMYLSRAFE